MGSSGAAWSNKTIFLIFYVCFCCMVEIRQPVNEREWDKIFEMRFDLLHRYLGHPKEKKKTKNGLCFIAVEGKEIVGTGCFEIERKLGHVRYVAVKRNFRHKGIGSMIMKELERVAKEKGLNKLYVNSRRPAKKFFRQLDFRPVGEEFKHRTLGTVHIRMEKPL